MSSTSDKFSVLMVCTGNICRSPMAEAVLQHLIKQGCLQSSFDRVESAGVHSFHVGEEPDDRTLAVLRKNDISWDSYAQKVKDSDFSTFTHILGMDEGHVAQLKRMQPRTSTAKVELFGDYGDGKEIDDPYYGGKSGFDKCYKQVTAYSEGLLKSLGFNDK